MGSSLSGVLACIYLEFLQSGPFKHIIPNTAHYFRYIDDILFIYPQDLELNSITDKLNNVEPSLKFTHELEYNCTLPFLDILLIRNINKLEFKFYRKTTCKNDHIHFYSHHNNNTKRGIIIGFYLRALRICSSKYLNDEFIHIENSFLTLQYPKSFIHYAKSKALKIHNNALLLHTSQHNHNIDFNSAKMLTYIHNKNLWRIFEAAAISFLSSLNTRPGFYNISPYLSKHILNSYNIFHP